MEIAQIKTSLDIFAVLNHYHLLPTKNNMLHCPFHADKTPSMQIYPQSNTLYCFSSNCSLQGKSIDQIGLIMHQEQCSKHEALLKAKVILGNNIIQTVTEKTKTDYNQLFSGFQTSLAKSKKATAYLQSRHLNDVALEIGYNSGTSYKHLKNCLIFPLKDQNNEIVSFYGRSIVNDKEQRHYYLNNRQGLYPAYPKPATKKLVLTESIIDGATLLKHTNYAILALYGTNGLTEEHLSALSALKTLEEVVCFFDGDAAGKSATQKYSQQLHQAFPNCTISYINTPNNEDIHSLLEGHDPSLLDHLIKESTLLFSTEVAITAATPKDTKLPKSDLNAPKEAINQSQSHLNTHNPAYLLFTQADLIISILGGISMYPIDKLKVTLKIERKDSRSPLHHLRHQLDLYQDVQVERLVRKGAERLEMSTRVVQLALATLTQALEDHRLTQIKAQKPTQLTKRELTDKAYNKAIQFLKAPNLLQRTNRPVA